MSTDQQVLTRNRLSQVKAGVGASLGAGLGMFPLGVAFGMLVIQADLPWWMAPALSVFVYAGSMEMLMIGLITAAAPLATIALTTFLVNFRHVFYPLSFPLNVVRRPAARAYSVYAMTDEAYAITAASPGKWNAWKLLSLQVALQLYWVGGGLVGVLAGSLLPTPIEGLEFALTVLFITLTLDACRSRGQAASLLLAAASFAVAATVLPGSALFGGLLLFVALLVVRYAWSAARGGRGSRA